MAFADRNGDNLIELVGYDGEITQEADYYPFGLRQQGAGLFAPGREPENRYLYNGIEHVKEVGLDLAAFRSYDAAIGRWVQVDPKAEAFTWVSPYNGMLNNPILHIDPFGDTTRVYNLSGELVNTINDSHVNQEHFLSEDAIGLLDKVSLDGESNLNGSLARLLSSYYVGHNTKTELSEILADSESDGKERHFLLVKGSSSKELQAVDITETGTMSRTSNNVKLKGKTILNLLNPAGTNIVGFGHTHPMAALKYGGNPWVLRKPTTIGGYPDYDDHLGLGSYPNIIASPTGYTIYSNKMIWYGTSSKGQSAPSNYGQHLSYLRSILLDDDVRN